MGIRRRLQQELRRELQQMKAWKEAALQLDVFIVLVMLDHVI